jgi:hypothetical protein
MYVSSSVNIFLHVSISIIFYLYPYLYLCNMYVSISMQIAMCSSILLLHFASIDIVVPTKLFSELIRREVDKARALASETAVAQLTGSMGGIQGVR